jgi:hypothetical protein
LPETVICSECGRNVKTNQYARHWQQDHYGEKTVSDALHKKADRNSKGPRNPTPNVGKKALSKGVLGEISQIIKRTSDRRVRRGINELLQRVFCEPRFLSDILRDGGFSEDEISRLKGNYIDAYLAALTARWCEWWKTFLSARARGVLVRRFGLKGDPPMQHEMLAKQYQMSPGAVEQLEEKSIGHLRRVDRRRELESIVVNTGREFLNM